MVSFHGARTGGLSTYVPFIRDTGENRKAYVSFPQYPQDWPRCHWQLGGLPDWPKVTIWQKDDLVDAFSPACAAEIFDARLEPFTLHRVNMQQTDAIESVNTPARNVVRLGLV